MDVSPTIQHPHGRIFSFTGTDPAANTNISETVPARRRWKILSLRFALVTAVAVADRIVTLTITDGTNILFRIISDTAQTADLTRYYNYHLQPVPQFLVGNDFLLPLPPITLAPDFQILTTTSGLQAADDYGAPQILIEEWIDP